MAVAAKGVTTDSVAPFYETPYRLSPVPARTVAGWRTAAPAGALLLPAPNPFVPGRLTLIGESAAEPRPARISSRLGFALWHCGDVEFGQPRTNFWFTVRSPLVSDSPRHAVLSALLVRMANDALDEFAYPAVLAGQTFALSRHHRGITVRLSGWSDKQDLLLARIVATLRALPLPPRRFEAQKSEYARHLRNADKRKSFRRAMSEVHALLIDPEWSDDVLLEALDTVEREDLREYAERFFERGEVVALAHGNVAPEDANALGNVLECDLLGSMRAERVAQARVVRLDPGMRWVRWLASEHEDHALAVYAQGRDDSVAEWAKTVLIARAMKDRFFHELRTERELGYIALATFLPLLEVPGLALVIQSPSHPPETLHQHVDAFIERAGTMLREMPGAVLERHRAAVERSLLATETRLGERTARHWVELDQKNHELDRRERILDAVRAVTRDELADAGRSLVVAPETARGAVVAVSSREPPASGEVFRGAESVVDTGAFKRGQRYFEESRARYSGRRERTVEVA